LPKTKNYHTARLIAFYLPQYHPIPENDEWWSKGFTEWTNVTKAKPLFRGHKQPNLPGELGFYDLRVPEVREQQAAMAKKYGVEGFCYWHYWFSKGKRLLERPFNEVLNSGKPDYPFCLAWANQTWTGIWHGASDRILIKQTYPGEKDYEAHFYSVLPAIRDARYICVDGKPLFIVYAPKDLPNPAKFTDYWQNLAIKNGLSGIFFVGIANINWDPKENGFDASTSNLPCDILPKINDTFFNRIKKKIAKRLKIKASNVPKIYDYKDIVNRAISSNLPETNFFYPCVMPNWDNTPRSGSDGLIFLDSSPELFEKYLTFMVRYAEKREPDHRIVFIKSWNEWAEGNYLEPDQKFGNAYLEVIKKVLEGRNPPYTLCPHQKNL